MPRRVSVIVAARNEEKTIKSCIESILNSDFPKSDYEVIVTDGISTDSTREIVSEYPVTLLMNNGMTASSGRNCGIRKSNAEYIAFTDSDCEVDRNWLKILVDALDNSDKTVAGVGGPLLIPTSSSRFERIVGIFQGTFMGSGGSIQGFIFPHPRDVNSISNSNAVYRKEAILRVGGFDEGFRKGQDADLNYRIRGNGASRFRYTPSAVVYHHRRGNLHSFMRQSAAYGEGMGRMVRKHKRIPRWYAPAPFLALAAMLLTVLLSFFDTMFFEVVLMLLLSYCIAALATIVEAFLRSRSCLSVGVFAIAPLMHLCYAIGFTRGIFGLSNKKQIRRTPSTDVQCP